MSTLATPGATPGNPVSNPTQQPSFGAAFARSFKRVLNRPQFLAAFIVLLVAAVSLNAATQFLRLYFKKEPVQLVKPLESVPLRLGPWVQVSKDQPLSHEMEDVLGTKLYIFRDYIDTRLVDEKMVAEITSEERTTEERAMMTGAIRSKIPGAHVRMAVTYYTGMVDTVAHIPDRCYVADGMVPDEKETPTWRMANKRREPVDVTVSSIHFEESEGRSNFSGGEAVVSNVAYFFHCNGEYEHDAIRGVRMRLQNLAERHAYYAKIELMTIMQDRSKSDQVLSDFLTNALPEVESCLPDWQQVKSAGHATNATAPPASASK